MSWDSFISEQSNSGVYATELFIKTTAVLLGMNIYITSEHCTPEHPYNIITSLWNDDDHERTSSSNAILIGNISGIHFQSLLPNPNLEVETIDHEIEATATSNVLKTSMHHMCLHARAEVMHYIDAPMKSLSISTSAPASRVKETLTFKLPYFAARDMNPIITPHSIGPMNNICPHCNALRFIDEPLNCCHNGKITLPELSFPEDLKQLLLGKSAQSKNFRDNTRQYNSAFAFASFGANIDKLTNRGPYCFCIHGQIYHRTGSLHPSDGSNLQYGQVYILEGDQAVETRMKHCEGIQCRLDTMRQLQKIMEAVSPYAAAFKHMYEVEREQTAKLGYRAKNILMIFKRGKNQRRYNEPRHDEVAAVFVGEEGAPPMERDIIIYPKDTPCKRISYMSANCDPMSYSLMFPRGDLGWVHGAQHNSEHCTMKRNTITLLQFYSYRLAVRKTFSAIHYAGKLFQQYVVDAYVKTEASRLDYIRRNQCALRVEMYQGLMDHLYFEAAQHNLQPGRMVILPSTFQGSPRAMQQNYQDAMAIVCKFGKPDLFLTFTCNPKAKSITENLPPGVGTENRPDLVARVFKRQLHELLCDIKKRHKLGKPTAIVYVIEFQKRGLPHCHILIILDQSSKLRDCHDIDNIISAEIPDETKDPHLHQIIKSCMMHGPCGIYNPQSVCMDNGVCTKNYPKEFSSDTVLCVNGYPQYRRRNNGRCVLIRGVHLDNRYIYICKLYECKNVTI